LSCNTLVYRSNARNLSVQLSLSQLAETLSLSYYGLCLLINKIVEKGRTGSAWKGRGGREREGVWGRERRWGEEGGGRGKRGEMAPTMYAHMNK
jgi:hypothetical protein